MICVTQREADMVFKTAGFNHSPIPPQEEWSRRSARTEALIYETTIIPRTADANPHLGSVLVSTYRRLPAGTQPPRWRRYVHTRTLPALSRYSFCWRSVANGRGRLAVPALEVGRSRRQGKPYPRQALIPLGISSSGTSNTAPASSRAARRRLPSRAEGPCRGIERSSDPDESGTW